MDALGSWALLLALGIFVTLAIVNLIDHSEGGGDMDGTQDSARSRDRSGFSGGRRW